MNDELNSGEAGSCSELCDKVKEALFSGEELDEEMKKHFDECEDCRTFPEWSLKLEKDLALLGKETFERDGISVADAVMKEIEAQSLFTGGAPLKKNRLFRHGGLVAACIIVVLMAIPVMNGMFHDKGSDSAYESVNDSAPLEESKKFKSEQQVNAEKEISGVTLYSDNDYNGSSVVYGTSTADYSANLQDEIKESGERRASGSSDGATALPMLSGGLSKQKADPAETGSGDGGTAAEPNTAESVAETESLFSDALNSAVLMAEAADEEAETSLESIALDKAKEVFGENIGTITFSEIHYTDSGATEVYFEFDSGISFTVIFENINGEWTVSECKSEQSK